MTIPPPPRRVPLSQRVKFLFDSPLTIFIGGVPLLLSGPFLILAIVLFSAFASDVDYDLIKENGSLTEAVITATEVNHHVRINGRSPLIIHYEYSDKEGREHQDSYETMPTERVRRLDAGAKVDIYHHNGQSVIAGLKPLDIPVWVFFIIPIGPFLIGSAFLIGPYLRARKKIRVYTWGRQGLGAVVSVEQAGGIFSPALPFLRAIYWITFTYTDETGEERAGKSRSKDLTLVNALRKNDDVDILIDPDRPELAEVVDDSLMMAIVKA